MDQATAQLVDEWYLYHAQLPDAKAFINKELELRKQVFGLLFPDPDEGVNTLLLPNGATIKATYKLTRNVDEAAVGGIIDLMRWNGYSPDSVFTWKPQLVIKEYRKLDQNGRHIVDMAVTAKPSAPSLEVTLPEGKGEEDNGDLL